MNKKNIFLGCVLFALLIGSSCIDLVLRPKLNIFEHDRVSDPNAPQGTLVISNMNPRVSDVLTFSVEDLVDDTTPADKIQIRWVFDADRNAPNYGSGTQLTLYDWDYNQTVTFSYSLAGTYTVGIQLKDANGDLRSITKNLTVRPLFEKVGFPYDNFDSTVEGSFAFTLNPVNSRILVAVRDPAVSYKAKVFEQSDTGWTSLGIIGTGVVSNLAIKTGSDSKSIVVFEDAGEGGKLHIMRYDNNGTWTDLGLIADYGGGSFQLEIGDDLKPVILSPTSFYSKKVYKWSGGTTWDDLGYSGSSFSESKLGIMTGSVPFVISGAITVSKYNGALTGVRWTSIGDFNASSTSDAKYEAFPGGSGGPSTISYYSAVGIDNLPIILYAEQDLGGNYVPKMKKYISGTTWSDLTPSSYFGPILIRGDTNAPLVTYTKYTGVNYRGLDRWSSDNTWVRPVLEEAQPFYPLDIEKFETDSSGAIYTLGADSYEKPVNIYKYTP